MTKVVPSLLEVPSLLPLQVNLPIQSIQATYHSKRSLEIRILNLSINLMKDFFKKTLDFIKANKLNVVFLVFVILQTILAGHFWLWTLLSFIPPLFYFCFFGILIVWNFIKNNYYGFLLLLLMTPF